MKRKLMRFTVFFLLIMSLSMPVFANSPPGGGINPVIDFILYAVFAFVSLMITLATESLLSLFFLGCGKYTGMILLTNLCSQLLMHATYAAVEGFFTHVVPLVVVLEVMVYAGEYLYYKRRMKDVSQKEILIFTISANTLSLLTGLWAIRVISG